MYLFTSSKPFHSYFFLVFLFSTIVFFQRCSSEEVPYKVVGTKAAWQTLEIAFQGPQSSEEALINPFLNYRLQVVFENDGESFNVPGFYAADGQSAESSANSGNIWKVRFTPNKQGTWKFKAYFEQGDNIAIQDLEVTGTANAFNGISGEVKIKAMDSLAPGFLGKGKLKYTGNRYLQFGGTGEYFLKGGAGSPENFLGYEDFDGTYKWDDDNNRPGEAQSGEKLHHYRNHLKDWKMGDPTWKNEKGKAMIGGLNYLASKGINSLYFLSMNINGDGKDVWPYTEYQERLRFDCSKLDQWEQVFSHMDKLGIVMHMVLQETENETLLDDGNTTFERKLYYREMIARFGHHLGLIWNMGEENGPVHWSPVGQNTQQKKDMVAFFKAIDPYKNLTTIHSHANWEVRYEMFGELLGETNLDGMSMQIDHIVNAHKETKYWNQKSAASGRQWVIPIDEIGPPDRGMDPDDRVPNNQDSVRTEVLWGNLMAGGSGVDWYFGFKNHNNDLGCEDWRSRDRAWDYTRHALDFFNREIPFAEMESSDNLIASGNAWCFTKGLDILTIYFPYGGTATLKLGSETSAYEASWYNPRTGEMTQINNLEKANDRTTISIGPPPTDTTKDWALLLKKI